MRKFKLLTELISDVVPLVVALGMSIYWILTGDMIKNDPYLLGMFRGVIWSILIISNLRLLSEVFNKS